MLRIKKNSLCCGLLLLFCGCAALVSRVPIMCLCVVLIQLLIIIIHAKVSFFSLFSFLLNFCFFQEYLTFEGFDVYGLLSLGTVPIYFFEMYICISVFNAIILIFIVETNCLEHESTLLCEKLDIGYQLSIALDICAVVITLLIFPSIPSSNILSGENRFFRGYIPFAGWSCIPHFLIAVAMANKKSRKFTLLAGVVIILWYMLHGERVDSIGLCFLMIIKFYHESRKKKVTSIKMALIVLAVIPVFIVVGMVRGGPTQITWGDILGNIVIQPTACDVTHVFNCAVDLAKKGKHFNGITYLSYVINCVPFLNDPYLFQEKIKDYYFSAGGGLFFAEPIANFGIAFACFFSAIYILCFTRLIKKSTRYRYLVYCALCIASFRTAWYGLNYPITTILYFVPAIIILRNILLRMSNKGVTNNATDVDSAK